MLNKYLSINIKATSTSWAVIDDDFNINECGSLKMNHINIDAEKIILEIKDLINKLQLKIGKLKAVVVILPGGINSEDNSLTSKSRWLSLPHKTNLKEIFNEHINKEIYFINDANASVMNASVTGDANKYKSIVYLICRTGVGVGVMLDGKCLNGRNSMFGEIGKLEMQGTTIETVLSYKTLLSKTILITGKEISTIAEIFELAKEDERIENLLLIWKESMIKTLASIVYIYDPDLIQIEATMLKFDYFKNWKIDEDLNNITKEREPSKIEIIQQVEKVNTIPLLGAVWSYKNK